MSTAIDGIDRLKPTGHALTARRPQIGRVRGLYEEAIHAKGLEYGSGEIPAEDMAAIRRAIRLQLEEEKSRRVMGAIVFLVVAAVVGAVIFMMTFG